MKGRYDMSTPTEPTTQYKLTQEVVLRYAKVLAIAICILWLVYPLVSLLLQALGKSTCILEDTITSGALGDTYGSLNTLFSGLAFTALVVTILLQMIEMREQRQEAQSNREEFEAQVERASTNILVEGYKNRLASEMRMATEKMNAYVGIGASERTTFSNFELNPSARLIERYIHRLNELPKRELTDRSRFLILDEVIGFLTKGLVLAQTIELLEIRIENSLPFYVVTENTATKLTELTLSGKYTIKTSLEPKPEHQQGKSNHENVEHKNTLDIRSFIENLDLERHIINNYRERLATVITKYLSFARFAEALKSKTPIAEVKSMAENDQKLEAVLSLVVTERYESKFECLIENAFASGQISPDDFTTLSATDFVNKLIKIGCIKDPNRIELPIVG